MNLFTPNFFRLGRQICLALLNGTWDRGYGTGTERVVGRGTRDGMNWEGEAPAEPKRRRVANGEWRVTNGF
jgi:hypothetical protein